MNLKLLRFSDNTIQTNLSSVWDISNVNLSTKYIPYINNKDDQKLIEYFITQFNENVIHVLPKLRKSIIHNDANDRNILVKNGNVSGIIDFGDIIYSALINELAVAVSYTILNKDKPLYWASYIVSAYHSVLPLRLEEINILYYLISARLCISICNSAYNTKKNPENKYISINQKPALILLKKLQKIEAEHAKKIFRSSGGLM